MYIRWSNSANQVSLAGRRSTIYIERAFSESRPREPEDVRFELEPERYAELDEHKPVSTSVAALDISPRNLPLTRQDTSIDMEQPAENSIDLEVADVGQNPAQVARQTRRANQSSHIEVQSPEVSFLPPPHVVKAQSPPPVTAVEQVAGVDDKTPPDFSSNRPPSYPAEAIRRRLEGTVLLRLRIDASGQVLRVEIVESSGHVILDRAAVKAIQTWRGHPAQRAGQPVTTVELLPVRFRLRE